MYRIKTLSGILLIPAIILLPASGVGATDGPLAREQSATLAPALQIPQADFTRHWKHPLSDQDSPPEEISASSVNQTADSRETFYWKNWGRGALGLVWQCLTLLHLGILDFWGYRGFAAITQTVQWAENVPANTLTLTVLLLSLNALILWSLREIHNGLVTPTNKILAHPAMFYRDYLDSLPDTPPASAAQQRPLPKKIAEHTTAREARDTLPGRPLSVSIPDAPGYIQTAL